MTRLLLLCTLAFAQASFALTSSARLLADEVPSSLEPAPAPSTVELTPKKQPVDYGWQFGAGAVAAAISIPVSFWLGNTLGSLSNNLIGAAIPALLCMGLIPPIAITLATWAVGNWNTPGKFRFWPAFLVNVVVNGVSLAIAGSAVGLMSVLTVPRIVLYTIVESIIQPAGSTILMRAFPTDEQPKTLANRDPLAPATFFVPTSTVRF